MLAGGIALFNCSKHDLFYFINGRYSNAADVFMYYITWLGQAEVIIPALLLLMLIPALRNWWYFFTALACNIIPFLIQHFVKDWLNYPRPQLLYKELGMHYLPQWEKLWHSSFPSGHSQGAFSFFCFLSLLLPQKYRALGLLFFLLAISVCYSRIYLAAHFFGDVYVGSMLGTVITSIVFMIMTKYRDSFSAKKNSVN